MPFHQSTFFVGLILVLATTAPAQQPDPVMDYATLLTSFGVRPDGRLQLESDNEPLTAVFLPTSAPVQAVITAAGSDQALHVQDFYKSNGDKVFTILESRGKYKEFKFTKPGEYLLTFRSGSQTLTQIPFSVINKSNNDEFNPQSVWYAQGPWSQWSYIYFLRRDGANANLEFRMWAHRRSFEPGTSTDNYDVVLKKDGDVIAAAKQGHVGTQYWRQLRFQLRNPASKGGRMFTLADLTAQDGNYRFVVTKNQQTHATFALTVKNGKPVFHRQQSSSFQPRHQYIIPRYHNLHTGISDSGDTVWMNRMTDADTQAAAASGAREVAGPTEEQRQRWRWLPTSLDPKRKFEFQTTDVITPHRHRAGRR